jgi:MFS superfamily sulfate permease-like transporter
MSSTSQRKAARHSHARKSSPNAGNGAKSNLATILAGVLLVIGVLLVAGWLVATLF